MEIEKKGGPKIVIQDIRLLEFPIIGGVNQVLEIKVNGEWMKVRVENGLTVED